METLSLCFFGKGTLERNGKQAEKSVCSSVFPIKNPCILTCLKLSVYHSADFQETLKGEKRMIGIEKMSRRTKEEKYALGTENRGQEASSPSTSCVTLDKAFNTA